MTQRLPPKKNERRRAEKVGRFGEGFAALYLSVKFFRILRLREKTPGGEIDIVARRGNMLIFVEVKTRRKRSQLAEALLAVNQRRIVKAAEFFLMNHPQYAALTIRFDVIFLAFNARPKHIANAFQPQANYWGR